MIVILGQWGSVGDLAVPHAILTGGATAPPAPPPFSSAFGLVGLGPVYWVYNINIVVVVVVVVVVVGRGGLPPLPHPPHCIGLSAGGRGGLPPGSEADRSRGFWRMLPNPALPLRIFFW